MKKSLRKVIHRNFTIVENNGEFRIRFSVGVRKKHSRSQNSFSSLEEAKKEVDFRFLLLRNEGKYFDGNKTVEFDPFADYEIDHNEYRELCNSLEIDDIDVRDIYELFKQTTVYKKQRAKPYFHSCLYEEIINSIYEEFFISWRNFMEYMDKYEGKEMELLLGFEKMILTK